MLLYTITTSSYEMGYSKTVGRSPKYTRKNLLRQIQKNLRNINWYSCHELSKAGEFQTFLHHFSFLYDTSFMARIMQVSGFRKFVLAKGLYLLRSFFMHHLTDERCTKFSWLSIQIIFSRKYVILISAIINFSKRAIL